MDTFGRDYRAGDALAATDTAWLERLIPRRVPLEDAKAAFATAEDEVKVVSCGTGDGVTAASGVDPLGELVRWRPPAALGAPWAGATAR